ncbi:exosortase A [Nitrosomonas sp. Nm51]|uniref:exosortase A n=1 Tax=Nitrosomonas sp. Nm51 TaxID=133720 RepID=UPI0008C14272|nr:exosortase A [Nitrosomonas sp. Nm51]SEQ88600.1 exosortase A [Nitrosomonas sp. Nm51]
MNTIVLSENSNRSSILFAILMTVLAIVGILAIYHETVWSMVDTWYRSDTYAHGFLILPFVIYMVWTKRQSIAILNQQPSPTALIGLLVLGGLWLIAELASVQVVMQYTVVAMLPIVVAAILGYRTMYVLAFPLAYLFFAVPFGDILIPPLINFTADFTVSALQLSGIPVYREGTFFSLPTGNWSVVEACSGLRYLIASVTLGTLYAYLTYRSLIKRIIFIAFSILVPIIANGIRAYLIVMTGHLSDMQLAVGVDHLIYGWIFFGFVMLLLFWVGSLWREDRIDDDKSQRNDGSRIKDENNVVSIKKTVLITGSVLAVALIWPIYAAHLEKDINFVQPEFNFFHSDKSWHLTDDPVSNWDPIYIGSPGKFEAHFINGEYKRVSLFITYYQNQRQGNELINSGNVLVPEMDSPWKQVDENVQSFMVGSREITYRQVQLRSYYENLLVWRWYVLDNDETISPYMAKVMLAKNRLLTENDFGAEVIVATPYGLQPDEAIPVLQQFLKDMLPGITDSLDNVNKQ